MMPKIKLRHLCKSSLKPKTYLINCNIMWMEVVFVWLKVMSQCPVQEGFILALSQIDPPLLLLLLLHYQINQLQYIVPSKKQQYVWSLHNSYKSRWRQIPHCAYQSRIFLHILIHILLSRSHFEMYSDFPSWSCELDQGTLKPYIRKIWCSLVVPQIVQLSSIVFEMSLFGFISNKTILHYKQTHLKLEKPWDQELIYLLL